MLRILTLVLLLLIIATAARAENLAFVGRTQNTSNNPNTRITISTPAGMQNKDVMLVFVTSYNSTPTPPSARWTSLGSLGNSSSDVGAAFVKVWHTGNPTSYTFRNVNYPKAIMRVYRGVTGVDSAHFAASSSGASALTIPALPATTVADDAYVAFFASDDYASAITGPANLADQAADQSEWSSFDGDKVVLKQGAVPPAEAARLASGTGNWIGFAATLGNHPSAPLLPYGHVAPPAGQSWQVTLDDEFNQDSSINTSLWNGGPGGPPGNPWPMCPTDNKDQLGNSGGSCNQFFGTFDPANPTGPYVAINPGVGLQVQAQTNYLDTNNFLRDTSQDWMGLQSYGNFTQKFGYFEISAQMPHDNGGNGFCGEVQNGTNAYGTGAGDGDGLHIDLWLVPPGRTGIVGPTGDEVDIAETELGPGPPMNVYLNVAENGGTISSTSYPGVSVGDLSAGFHRYAAYWRNDGSGAFGSVQTYFDGQPIGSPVPLNDFLWGAGVYIFAGWMQQTNLGSYFTGCLPSATTSNNNPLIIQYVRVWQAQ